MTHYDRRARSLLVFLAQHARSVWVTGRFASLPVRHLDASLPGRVATGRQRRSYSIAKYRQTGGETSREVAKRFGIETSKGAKRPAGGESSRWRTGKVAKRPSIVCLCARQSKWPMYFK